MKISLKHAYGIKLLNHQFCDKKKLKLIYSPNGIFKTSFSKIFNYWKNENKEKNAILDKIYKKEFKGEIVIDDKKFTEESELKNILVYSSELIQETKNYEYIKKLLVDEQDIEIYRRLEENIAKYRKIIFEILKDTKMQKTYSNNIGNNLEHLDDFKFFFENILKKYDIADNYMDYIDISNLNIKAYKLFFHNKNYKEMAEIYQDKIKQVKKTHFLDENFSLTELKNLLRYMKENNYLNENRGLIFKVSDTEYNKIFSIDSLEKIVDEINESIITDVDFTSNFEKLENELDKTKAGKAILNSLKSNPDFFLQNTLEIENLIYFHIKKQMKISLDEIANYHAEVCNDIESYKQLKTKMENNENPFRKAIKTYKKIFNPVFDLEIKNINSNFFIEDIKPEIVFKYTKVQNEHEFNENEILEILSSGERSTLLILKFILEYESLKKEAKNDKIIIILDDIVESFDYANKFSFLEYLNYLVYGDDNNNVIFLLTHNFDFYKRVKIIFNQAESKKAYLKDGEVKFTEISPSWANPYKNIKNINNWNDLISSLPFYRELMYLSSNNTENIKKLSNFFHYIDDNLKMSDLHNMVIKMTSVNYENLDKNILGDNYFDYLKKNINTEVDIYDLKGKILLAIACRVSWEEKAKKSLEKKRSKLPKNNKHYFSELLNLVRKSKDLEYLHNLGIKVRLATPEFIHVNNFMYEPLIDIDPGYLISLYKKIEEYEV